MKTRLTLFALCLCSFFSCKQPEQITLLSAPGASGRINFGLEKLSVSLEDAGYKVDIDSVLSNVPEGKVIAVGAWEDTLVNGLAARAGLDFGAMPAGEGFSIRSAANLILIKGSDASGALYGCLELNDSLKANAQLPDDLQITDAPEMVMRGACIGMQKTEYLPGRRVYEYPYTPESFPWFYDKELWVRYLDMLVENRMNSLYLWNGHPFSSLVKLEDYPEAIEVDEETFKKNEEIFRFLTEEADKRGIWVIQMFYNILIPKPFAEKRGLETQDRSRPIMPEIADYTRKSVAAFIEKYPNVGLLMTLGEAINTIDDDVEWFTKTIIPGVKDGLEAIGETGEPPILLRAHDTDASRVMDAALPLYSNLYTMHKYNGESLTTYQPRGPWSQIHKDLSSLGSVHISNVHVLANLEPFRYGSPAFIQKSVQAMHNVHGANGLHLFPQASYWEWPYTADKTDERLLQIDRDWIWYQAWGRYAWDSKRDRESEIGYWSEELADFYGCGPYGEQIMEAYDQAGEIAPKLLRRFGITEGNRQTLLLGMFMSQLVNPYKWRVYPGFYESCGPVGEILIDYAEKEWKGEPHVGETPPQIIQEVTEHGRLAVAAIEEAAAHVTANKAEFERLRNDIHCYEVFANFFSMKVQAAMLTLRYRYSQDPADLEKAVPLLEKSLEYYEELVALTKDTYLYANSMQTAQRRIPIGGDDGKNKTWAELLPHYQEELVALKKNIDLLQSKAAGEIETASQPWEPARVELLEPAGSLVALGTGKKIATDESYTAGEIAEELKELSFLPLSMEKQEDDGTVIRFRSEEPLRVVVGYFNSDDNDYLKPPVLETNAGGNDRGQAQAVITNGMLIEGQPRINVHTYAYEAGEHTLNLGKGIAMVLGFAKESSGFETRDAGIIGEGGERPADWMFY